MHFASAYLVRSPVKFQRPVSRSDDLHEASSQNEHNEILKPATGMESGLTDTG